MKRSWFLVFGFLVFAGSAISQTRGDSSFSLMFNPSMSFTQTNDEHINHWLARYGYPTIPRVPSSYNFELAAMPAYSRLLLSIRCSTINSVNNLSSFNMMAGLYAAVVKSKSFLVFAGGATGLHRDIITLNGNLPPEYQQLATRVHSQLALRRAGLRLEPGVRVFWYPVQIGLLQIGLSGGLAYDVDLNSHWKLGYYSNNHGRYSHFRGITRPNDQVKVSDHGLTYGGGLSFRFHLH